MLCSIIVFFYCYSPVWSSLDWGDKVITQNHKPPTHPNPTLNGCDIIVIQHSLQKECAAQIWQNGKQQQRWVETLLTTVNNKKITLKGRHLEVFSFYQFELTYFVQIKLAIMIKNSRYGNELKVLTEEREFILLNNEKIYTSPASCGQYECKLN